MDLEDALAFKILRSFLAIPRLEYTSQVRNPTQSSRVKLVASERNKFLRHRRFRD